MTILLLVALVVWAVYLGLRVRQLEHVVAALRALAGRADAQAPP